MGLQLPAEPAVQIHNPHYQGKNKEQEQNRILEDGKDASVKSKVATRGDRYRERDCPQVLGQAEPAAADPFVSGSGIPTGITIAHFAAFTAKSKICMFSLPEVYSTTAYS